jgi:iron complex transport system substrate-binding protein
MVMRVAVAAWLLAGVLLAQPRRIVSTAPAITEILYALGLGDRVVGVTDYCHYPPEARSKPKIGPFIRPDLEAIVALRPDLVIILKNPLQLFPKLRALNQNVVEVDHDTVPNIYRAIGQIAAAAGVPARGAALNRTIQTRLTEIRGKVAKLPRRRVLFVVGRTPGTLEGIVGVGGSSYLNELMSIAGGDNMLRDAVAAYPKVPAEEILARNPEVIVDMGDMSDTDHVTEAQKRAVAGLWNRFPMLSAVRSHRVYGVAADIFVVPGPRIAEAARAFARMFHPEAGL